MLNTFIGALKLKFTLIRTLTGALKLKLTLGKMFPSLVHQTPMFRKVMFLPKVACKITKNKYLR